MPVSTLNKVISLLVIGSLAVAALLIIFWTHVSSFLATNTNLVGASGVGFIALLVFTASSLFVGAVIDGVAELFVRPLVHRSLRGGCLPRFCGLTYMFNIVTKWEARVSKLIRDRKLFSGVDEPETQKNDSASSVEDAGSQNSDTRQTVQIAAAIFFGRANKDLLDWVTSHHSTYYLATGFLITVPFIYVAVLVNFVIIPSAESWAHATVFCAALLLAALIVCYFLLVLAVERYLYTYESVFRFVAVCLDVESSKYLTAQPAVNRAEH